MSVGTTRGHVAAVLRRHRRERVLDVTREAACGHQHERRCIVALFDQRADMPEQRLRARAGSERTRMQIERTAALQHGGRARARRWSTPHGPPKRRTARRRLRRSRRASRRIRRAPMCHRSRRATSAGRATAPSRCHGVSSCWQRAAATRRARFVPRRRTPRSTASPERSMLSRSSPARWRRRASARRCGRTFATPRVKRESSTRTHPFDVDEARRADLHAHFRALERRHRPKRLAVPLAAVRNERERDPRIDVRTPAP